MSTMMMSESETEILRYPIGKFTPEMPITDENVSAWIDEIEELPAQVRKAVGGLSEEQLDTPYRPDGWTLRQVVHHLADSHMNAFIRFKLAMTEDKPTIKPYEEDLWAKLPDAALAVDVSLALLENLHTRLVALLRSLSPEDLDRTFIHPELKKEIPLRRNVGMYAWHGKHHTAHIQGLRERMGW